mmetsp:Transcript_27474/g.71132  ORF Transcript_27474/g.71132 Transcript_27474/m.71132 type:complete len:251 (+) Transcript_27474:386-1138(+)
MALPTYLPCWAATCAVGALPDNAQSPIAKTPSAPRTCKRSSTLRPRAFSPCPNCWASFLTTGRAPIPAAQTRAPTRSVLACFEASAFCSAVAPRGSDGWYVTASAVTPVTAHFSRTSTPRVSRCVLAKSASCGSKGPKTRGIASASTILNRSATSLPYRRSMSSFLKSANSAQSSTPVGPPPTTTTVSSASTTWLHSPHAIAAAARSKLLRRRACNFALSSASLRKSAFSWTPGMPKVLGCAPTAMTSLS